jgi:chromate transporter
MPPSLRNITHVFTKLGNLTFGGGNATIAVLHQEIILRLKWITEDEFALSFAISRLTPGSNFFAFCVAVGWILRRTGGALLALIASSIPCSLVVMLVTMVFSLVQSNPVVQSALHGAIAAAVSITFKTAWILVRSHLLHSRHSRFKTIFIFALSLFLHGFLKFSPIEVIGICAILGLFYMEAPT